MSSLEHQYAIPWRQSIYNSRFSGSSTRSGINENGAARLENKFHSLQDFDCHIRKFRTAVVNNGLSNGAQHAIRNIGGSGNLKKVAAGVNHGYSSKVGYQSGKSLHQNGAA